jgi:hypothetical protein
MGIVHSASRPLIAFRTPSHTAIVAAGAVNGFDQVQHRDLFGGLAEAESAVRAFAGFEEPVAGELLQELRQKVTGYVGV